MSTSKKQKYGLQHVSVELIHWFNGRNGSRTGSKLYGPEVSSKDTEEGVANEAFQDKAVLAWSLASRGGWLSNHGIQGCILTAEQQEEAVREIHAEMERLNEAAEAYLNGQSPFKMRYKVEGTSFEMNEAQYAKYYENMHFNKNGQVKKPIYGAVCGFRRGNAVVLADYMSTIHGDLLPQGTAGFKYDIPIDIVSYDIDSMEAKLLNLQENASKREGDKPVTLTNLILSGWELYQGRCNQSQLAKALGLLPGTKQKIFRIYECQNKYRDIPIIENYANRTWNPKPVDKEFLKKNFLDKNADEDEVMAYFADPTKFGKKGNAPKIMKRDDIEGLSRHPVDIVAKAAEAVFKNEEGLVQVFEDNKDLLNFVSRQILQRKKYYEEILAIYAKYLEEKEEAKASEEMKQAAG